MPILSVIIRLTVQRIYRPLFAGLLVILSATVWGKTIQVLDQNGNPVTHAVLSVDGAVSSDPLTMATMDQVDKQFVPRVLVINKGQQVDFPNSDNVRHHVYSFSSPKPFEIKLFAGTEADPVTFDKPGIVVLGCNIHDQMIGYIYVADNELTFLTDPNGYVDVPDDVHEIRVWHERLSNPQTIRVTRPINQEGRVVLELLPAKQPEKAPNTFGARFGKGA